MTTQLEDMTLTELCARLSSLADHQHPERLNPEADAMWRLICIEAAERLSCRADVVSGLRGQMLLLLNVPHDPRLALPPTAEAYNAGVKDCIAILPSPSNSERFP